MRHQIRHAAASFFFNKVYPSILRYRERKVGRKKSINVVFIAMNVAMWRYQQIYELLKSDDRFRLFVVLSVATTYNRDQVIKDIEQLRVYFNKKDIKYLNFDENSWIGFDLKELNPDIIFYPQPYDNCLYEKHDYKHFLSKLLCFVPYGIGQTEESWFYNTLFHNFAWKLYYPFQVDLERSQKLAHTRGKNMVISGYTNFDLYSNNNTIDVWKIKDPRIKRLIWAPHFSISPHDSLYSHSNFLWMAGFMHGLAKQYKDVIQIAFKPHPRLKSELYKHPDWGKAKTDSYYEEWNNMQNAFVETGDFIDLFKSSDAMIHDCSSFAIEYLFVNKPVAFVSKDINETFKDIPKFGRDAINQHYILSKTNEIFTWIENVLINGNDTMKEQRESFYKQYLEPKSGITASESIVNDIKTSLRIK